jgi:hypothetical protein
MLLDGSTSLMAGRSTDRLQVSNSLLDGATFTMGDPPSEAAAPMQQHILLSSPFRRQSHKSRDSRRAAG